MANNEVFSEELEKWLKSNEPKTFDRIEQVFGDRSFAIIFLVFMAFPALPIPTGGISHILEVLTILVAIQPMLGLKKLWVPESFRGRALPASFVKKVLPLLMRRVKWFEKYSRVRGAGLLKNSWFQRFAALSVIVFTLSALLAVPFSGLDTLPAIGVVIISLGLIIGDISFFIVGFLVGLTGLVLEITVGAALISGIAHLLHNSTPQQRILAYVLLAVLLLALILRLQRKKD